MLLLVVLPACITTTGEIKGNAFYLDGNFTVDMLDDDWVPSRQQAGVANGRYFENTHFEISFNHKNSNGFIGVNAFEMSDAVQARSLEVTADGIVANSEGMKLSQKMMKVDGVDAVELIISGKEMAKYVFLKKGKMGYILTYSNTPTYFDQNLATFEKFLGSFKAL
jgi:hypothetical protein